MFDCYYVVSLHMPCTHDCYMPHFVASHTLSDLYFHCVECNIAYDGILLILGLPISHHTFILLMNHVFRHLSCLLMLMVHMPITFGCAHFIRIVMHSFHTLHDRHDNYTCLVTHHLNVRCGTNANCIHFSKYLLCLFMLQDSQGGATLEQGHMVHLDCKYLVSVNFHIGTPSLPHGNAVLDLRRTDHSQGGRDDVIRSSTIIMDSPLSSRDTCIRHTKVKSFLYACPFGLLEDGILLDPPPLCTHRFEWSSTHVEEEVIHKSTTTPSAREAWKRRQKRRSPQLPDVRSPPDFRPGGSVAILVATTGFPTMRVSGHPRDHHRLYGLLRMSVHERTSGSCLRALCWA